MKPYVFSMYFSTCLCRILFYDACQLILHAFVISKRGLSFCQLIIYEKWLQHLCVYCCLKRGRMFYYFLDDEATLTGNRVLLSNESLCSCGNKFFPISGDPSVKRRQTPTQFVSLKVYIFALRLLFWLIYLAYHAFIPCNQAKECVFQYFEIRN